MNLMSDFKVFDIYENNSWEQVLNKFPNNAKDIYYSASYYKLFQNLGDGIANCFFYINNNEFVFYPFLMNSVNELGYNLGNDFYDIQGAYGYNGVVSNSQDPNFISAFYLAFDDYCKKNNIIAEFTRFHPILQNQNFSKDYMTVLYDRQTVLIDLLNSYDDIWNCQYSSKNRNMIRKAQKNGLRIEIINDPKDEIIDKFIAIYTETMQNVNADNYYFFSKEFFYNIFKLLKGFVFLANVLNNNEIVSSSIFLRYGKYLHYHLSGRTCKADNTVNNFLIDSIVKYGQELGLSFLHLGGGISGDENDPLFRFKRSFSNMVIPFYIGKRIHNFDVYNEVCSQWENKYPTLKLKYKQRLLKYREIEK